MFDASQLTSQALSLPLEDRIRLAQELWASLQPVGKSSVDEEAEALDVAEQRDKNLQDGLVDGVSHADAMAKARKSLE